MTSEEAGVEDTAIGMGVSLFLTIALVAALCVLLGLTPLALSRVGLSLDYLPYFQALELMVLGSLAVENLSRGLRRRRRPPWGQRWLGP